MRTIRVRPRRSSTPTSAPRATSAPSAPGRRLGNLESVGGEADHRVPAGVQHLRPSHLAFDFLDIGLRQRRLPVAQGVRRHRQPDLDLLRPIGIKRYAGAPAFRDEVVIVQNRGEETLAEDVHDELALGGVDVPGARSRAGRVTPDEHREHSHRERQRRSSMRRLPTGFASGA